MIKEFTTANSFDWREYENTASKISSLKSRLPEEAAKSLAYEVLHRITDRFVSKSANNNKVGVASNATPSEKQIEELARALVSDDLGEGRKFVSNLYDSGVLIDDIYLNYLAASARRLGDWWDQDKVSFVEVTLGTSRVYGILRMLDKLRGYQSTITDKSAVFATVPGDVHTLGISMAGDIFRSHGWEIELLVGMEHDELLSSLGKTDKVIIGVSAGGVHSLAALAKLILAIRINRPEMLILLSGAIVEEAKDMLNTIDADAMTNDMDNALTVMEEFWSQQQPSAT